MHAIQQSLRYFCFFLFIALAGPAQAVTAGWSPLLEPPEVADILAKGADLRVLHVTGDYEAGHIPGAVKAPYSRFRGPQDNPGALPNLAALTALVQALGIDADTAVLVVHAGNSAADMGAAARVYWTLKSLGVQQLAVLNGGFNAWREQGLPISTESASVPASRFEPQWNDQWQMTTTGLEALVKEGDARLVDARPPAFYQGLQASSARPGTIRGADNLSFTSWFEGNAVSSLAPLADLVEQGAAPVTVSFCNTGHLAAINWFVMSELAGIDNTRLYPESMTEWTMARRPMDNEPSRIRHYWAMTVSWLSDLVGGE